MSTDVSPTPTRRSTRKTKAPNTKTSAPTSTPPPSAGSINPATVRQAAELLKHFSDPTRLAVVLRLHSEGPADVGTICRQFNLSQPALSHHLALLRHARIVEPTRDGKRNIYAIHERAAGVVGELAAFVGGEGGQP